jgi:hypothetical protein
MSLASPPDISLLTKRETPAFIEIALEHDAFVACALCEKIVGVGMNRADAEHDALTGGTAVRTEDGEFLCTPCEKVMREGDQ